MNRKTLQLYWRQVRLHKLSFFTMLTLIPLGVLCIDTLLPYFLSQAIGGLTEDDIDNVFHFLVLAGVVGLIGGVLNFLGFQAGAIHQSHVMASLRTSTFASLLRKDHAFFTNQKIGAMTGRYIDFVRSETALQDLFIIRTLGFTLSVGTGIVILWLQSWVIALMAIGLITVLVLQIRWSTKFRAPWRHERKELVGKIHGEVADSLTNNLIVRTFGAETREIKDLTKHTDRFQSLFRKDVGFALGEGSVRIVLMIAVQITAISVAATMVHQGEISLAIAIFVLTYLQRIASQLFILGEIINGYDQAFLDAQPMTEMLLVENQVSDRPDAKTLSATSPDIEFAHMSYRYEDGEDDVLHDIDLRIPTGQKVGLVGHSGAGKTTVSQLLLRFADVTGGSISIDGHDIRDVTQQSLREHIAFVPQEPLLFHRSLRENIAYGKPDASDDEILLAAKQANALEFIEQLPEGLDTTVGERGVKLSGGQRQRIAIARAILKDAPILVLDEATSALDSESEKLIQDSLETLMQGRTSIVIAHRLSTIAKLDRIIVLEQGKIIEDGTHTELLKKRGTYATLWNHQSGGFIEE